MAPSAQTALESPPKASDYARALDLYRAGKYSEAVDLVLGLSPTTLRDAVKEEADYDVKALDAPALRRLEISAVLLVDAAGVAFLRNDVWAMSHVTTASGIIARLNALGQRTRAVRNWYVATAALFEGARSFPILRSHLADARRLYPGDAGILMASGSALETESKNLDDAAEFYRASLAIDGSNAQSRVRLARVLLRLGDAAASLAELDRMPAPSDERMAYFRELFRASALVALKRPPDAERKFVSALEWNAQAPYLGIAESMAARGDDAGARKVIAKLLTANVDQEPWAAYLRGQWRYFPELIVEARLALK